jgi:putative FmdB family regulatory protein
MPFYEYECSHCHFYSEVMQKISDTPLKKCPSCGKNTFKKLISVPVFRLKGSGWYETDFKSDQERKRNLTSADKEEAASKAETKSEGAAAANDSSASDAKPAKTAESAGAAAPAKPAAAKPGAASEARSTSSSSGARRGPSSRRAVPAKAASKRAVKAKARRRPRGAR